MNQLAKPLTCKICTMHSMGISLLIFMSLHNVRATLLDKVRRVPSSPGSGTEHWPTQCSGKPQKKDIKAAIIPYCCSDNW